MAVSFANFLHAIKAKCGQQLMKELKSPVNKAPKVGVQVPGQGEVFVLLLPAFDLIKTKIQGLIYR